MQRPKRPRDPSQLAKAIVGIATGEAPDAPPPDDRDPAAVALGSKGGKARAKSMSAAKRSEIAKRAARKRWEQS